MKPPLAKLYPCILMNIFMYMQIITSKNIHSTHLIIIEVKPSLARMAILSKIYPWMYFDLQLHLLNTRRLNSYMYISNIFILTSENISCTDLDTRMAPAELRVPEAMIALDLWLPAVQEVTNQINNVIFIGQPKEAMIALDLWLPAVQEVIIRNCCNQVLCIINWAIRRGNDYPWPLVFRCSRGHHFSNCYNQVLCIIYLAIKWGSDCPRPLVACRSRGYY